MVHPPSPAVPPSTLPIRLLTSDSDRPYIGRLEVYHDGQWGTVCQNNFYYVAAHLACMELNYTRGAICYDTLHFPVSTGNIIGITTNRYIATMFIGRSLMA